MGAAATSEALAPAPTTSEAVAPPPTASEVVPAPPPSTSEAPARHGQISKHAPAKTKISRGLAAPKSCLLRLLVSTEQEGAYIERRYGKHAWQTSVVHFLHSIQVQLASVALLCLDILVIVVELYIDMEWPKCHIIKRDAISCCSAASSGGHHGRLVARAA